VRPWGVSGEIGPEETGAFNPFYARFLEDGTVNMPPHAFAGPAFDRHVPEFISEMALLGVLL
jgi:HK97 gp10 family phage protein